MVNVLAAPRVLRKWRDAAWRVRLELDDACHFAWAGSRLHRAACRLPASACLGGSARTIRRQSTIALSANSQPPSAGDRAAKVLAGLNSRSLQLQFFSPLGARCWANQSRAGTLAAWKPFT